MGCGASKSGESGAAPQAHEPQQQQLQQQQQQKPHHKPATPPEQPHHKTSSHHSPIYKTLPKGAEQHPVRNVYDGDTLTLTDERRVRFLGIDTPELKEKQAYAQEAKDYTKERCHKKDIWIVIDGQDHYGRLLAHVFVPAEKGSGYLCVNEGLVQHGFAYAYIPNKDEKTFNWDKLIALQKQARHDKRGVWKNFKDETVYATTNGSAYHRRECTHISSIHHLRDMKISEAADLGLHPCRTCMAD